MVSRTVHALFVLAGMAALAAACTDLSEPEGAQPSARRQVTLSDAPIDVVMLQRATPLAAPVSASAWIDRSGGTISIPEAGFSIRFPGNALPTDEPKLITVTALPGGNVAYEFQPEGLVFANDPTITQDLKVTEVAHDPTLRRALEGVYFPDAGALGSGTARVRETRPAVVDATGWKMRFTVHHFSGYGASTRRIGGYIGSSGFIAF